MPLGWNELIFWNVTDRLNFNYFEKLANTVWKRLTANQIPIK